MEDMSVCLALGVLPEAVDPTVDVPPRGEVRAAAMGNH